MSPESCEDGLAISFYFECNALMIFFCTNDNFCLLTPTGLFTLDDEACLAILVEFLGIFKVFEAGTKL